MSMKPRIIFLWIVLAACSPDKKNEESGVNICPDLQWLEAIKTSIVQSGVKGEIYLTRYNGTRAFEINPCVTGCADAMTTIQDCEGKILCRIGGIAGFSCPGYAPTPAERTLFWKN